MPLAPPVSLHAATPKAPSRLGLPIAFVSLFAFCLPLAVLSFGAPRFSEIFRDFGVRLPLITRTLLDIGNALSTPIGLGIAVGLLIVWFMAVCIAARHARPLAIAMLILAILLSLVLLATSVIAFQLPLTEMIEQLQGQHHVNAADLRLNLCSRA